MTSGEHDHPHEPSHEPSHEHADGEPTPHEGWQDALRAKGHRLTPQRELVLSAVDRLGHATPDELLQAVRETSPAVNVSTIYRTLELLEELGLVRHTHLSDRAPTYHSTATPQHVHLVCRDCRVVREAGIEEFEPLAAALKTKHAFIADIAHLTVFGHCETCEATPLIE